jgi:BrnA antitoxin of type II toxin-antitoxin system
VNATIGLPVLKTAVNAKFDVDVVNWFKGQGRGYQTRMNAVLRHYMKAYKRVGKTSCAVLAIGWFLRFMITDCLLLSLRGAKRQSNPVFSEQPSLSSNYNELI